MQNAVSFLPGHIHHIVKNYAVKSRKIALISVASLATSLLLGNSVHAQEADAGIAGVIAPGAKLELIKDGFDGTEGPIAAPDGSFLFTETRANRIVRIAADNSISSFLENTNGSNGLAFNTKGDLVTVQVLQPRVGIVYPAGHEKVFAEQYEGKALQRPNDLVINKRDGVYFTDSGVAPKDANAEPAHPAVYYVTADGKLTRIINDVERPNGIQLSRDEKTLYVANTNGEYVLAYSILGDGKLGPRKEFAKLDGIQKTDTGISSGADGLAIDAEGRLYVASNLGIQVFDINGKALGIIPVPQKPQNLAFAGKDKKVLYVVGRGAAYKVATLASGFKGRAK